MKNFSLKDVENEIKAHLPHAYWFGVWHQMTAAGIEFGVNYRNRKGSRASLMPIGEEHKMRYAKFLANEVLKYDVDESATV